MKKNYISLLLMTLLLLIVAGCSNDKEATGTTEGNSDANKETEAVAGGTLNIAYSSEPITLDAQITGDTAAKDISRSIFESLVILDAEGNVQPDLAEKIEVSDDQKVYTFDIRKGIKFHNGKELTADDVEASLNRWIKLSSLGKTNFIGATVEKTGDYQVKLTLQTPNVNTLALLADPIPAAGIYPKEIVENAPDEGTAEIIGTGPYKLKEWKKNQYIALEKFEDYSSEGRTIQKQASLDGIQFNFISDESTRISGVTAGQYDIAVNISPDNAKQIESTSNVENIVSPGGFMGLFYNTKNGLFSNLKIRQAVNTLLDSEAILTGTYGSTEYYELTSSIVAKEFPNYYSEAGSDQYNLADPEKAKALLKEAGYNGEEVVIITTRDWLDSYNTSLVIQQQLESIGIKVKLEVQDTQTLFDTWTSEKNWDLAPVSWAGRATIFQGFWTVGGAPVEKSQKYLDAIKAVPTVEEAREEIDAAQQYVWDELPFTLIGHKKHIAAVSTKVTGYEFNLGPVFYNVSKSN